MDPQQRMVVPQRQPSFAPFLLLLLFYFLLSSPPPTAESSARTNMERALARRLAEINGLRDWVNGTAEERRREEEADVHRGRGHGGRRWNETGLFEVGQDVARIGRGAGGEKGFEYIRRWVEAEERQREGAHYLRNITGFLKGQWTWSEATFTLFPHATSGNATRRLQRRAPIREEIQKANISAYDWQRGWFPWAGPNASTPDRPGVPHKAMEVGGAGKVILHVNEGWTEDTREDADIIRGTMSFSVQGWNSEVNFDVEGIHFFDNGSFYLQAWPDDKYLDTRSVLSMALDAPRPDFAQYSPNDGIVSVASQRLRKQGKGKPLKPRKDGQDRIRMRRQAEPSGEDAAREAEDTNAEANVEQAPENTNVSVPAAAELAPSPTWQQRRIAAVVIADLERRVQKIRDILRTGDFPDAATSPPTPALNLSQPGAPPTIPSRSACAFLFYGFLSPLPTSYPPSMVAEYESSLLKPTGASTPKPPPPELSGLLVSENCGLVVQVDGAKTLLAPLFWEQGRMYAWVTGLVVAVQVWLLTRQMDARQSPAACSRISYTSVLMQVGMDACIFSNHLTLAIMTDEVSSLPLLIPAFFACISAVLFGMRYSTLVRLHAPSEAAPVPRHPATTRPLVPSAEGPLLPTTVTPIANVATPQRDPPFEDGPTFLLALFGGAVLGTTFIIIFGIIPLLMIILFSYWIPQIIHNVKGGSSRRGLRKRFIIGTTICRLYLPLYFWTCPANVLFADPSPWVWVLAVYSALQAAVLCLQDLISPRFFLPSRYFPEEDRWNYHPNIPPTDIEAPGKMPTCNICFERIDMPAGEDDSDVAPSTGGPQAAGSQVDAAIEGIGRTLNRWSYMVPPCHHISHTKCLESWMSIKLECPSCRRSLPPV